MYENEIKRFQDSGVGVGAGSQRWISICHSCESRNPCMETYDPI